MADIKTEEYYQRILDLIDANDILVSFEARAKNCERIARLCGVLGTYKNCRSLKEIYERKAIEEREKGLESDYLSCLTKYKEADSIDTYKSTEMLLRQLGSYKDSTQLAEACHSRIVKLKLKAQAVFWVKIIAAIGLVVGFAVLLVTVNHNNENQYQVTVSNVAKGIRISPSDTNDMSDYTVYRESYNSKEKQWSEPSLIGYIREGKFYLDTDVHPGSIYRYAAIRSNSEDQKPGFFTTIVRITTREIVSIISNNPNEFTVRWSGSTLFDGYQVQYTSVEGSFGKAESVLIDSKDRYSTTIDGLEANATYYVRVRSYHRVNGVVYYGGWSPTVGIVLTSSEG